jgi:hypothetical protein
MRAAGEPPQERARPRGSRAVLALVTLAGAALALWALVGPGGPREQRFALSPQECNTECQSRQTDCIDECDGKVACERRCTEAGLRCVSRCRGLDAGAGGMAGSGGAAGSAGGGGRAGTGGGGGRAGAP